MARANITRDFITSSVIRAFFVSPDCSGALLLPSQSGFLPINFIDKRSGAHYLEPTDVRLTSIEGILENNGFCRDTGPSDFLLGEGILVPQLEDFIPPFEMVTRGEFLAMQEGN